MTPERSPVMADVARIAGVSHQTVSRVLNHHPNVRQATRDRVVAAIEELGYRRNLSARALVTRRTNTLGVVAFDTTLYGPASTLFGLEQAARDAGYFISIVSLKTINRKTVGEALDYLAAQAVDGLIAIAPQVEAAAAVSALQGHVPVVAVEGGEADGMPVVAVDQTRGAELATRHLLDLGHRTVWHVAGPADWLEAEGRRRGWRRTLEAAGIAAPPVVAGDWSPRAGYAAGRHIADAARAGRATAVFVSNDQMALGLLRALHEAGIRVPQDVSIVGFDDIPEAEFLTPPLTTIRQDFAEVGRKSIALLLDLIETGPGPETARVVVAPALVTRASTAPPATT
ncbi:LacI family DNA-binding transcriptional regulator [Jiangella sp. DSM 45060]|uniref:LacI family DNA-binding transcriptional regulator n=1 Tax=Jiangella sp. DSM 45060 TaxID=1798224 RepID=UPI00087A81E3|nr:LacI family DNA-binding transcriptional regulator [Jiangella sp. DSM 45060]SDT70145.1 DNA-binding transcriptional regulator, LacI/PurR family [Jiangella sp. DSM 45060]